MSDPKKSDEKHQFDDVLRRMLSTPPKPHEPKSKPKKAKSKRSK